MSEPKKVDRRNFIYAGLGAVALIAIGAAAYVAMNPPVVTQTVTTSTTVPTTTVITQPTTTVITTTVPTTSVVTTTVPTTSVVPAERFELDIWRGTSLNSVEEGRWNLIAKMFEDTHSDVKITYTQLPNVGALDKMLAAWAAGVGFPEIVTIGDRSVPQAAQYIEPLDELMDDIKKIWGEDLLPNIFPKSRDKNGEYHHYHAIVGWRVDALHTRFDMLEKAGLDASTVISSLTNFDKALYKIKEYFDESGLTAEGAYPMCVQLSPKAPGDGSAFVGRLIATINGIPIATSDGGLHIDQTPEQVKGIETAFAMLKRWYDDGIIPPECTDLGEYDNNAYFQLGKDCFTHNAISSIYTWMEQNRPPFYQYYGFLPFPKSDVNGREMIVAESSGFAISRNLDAKAREIAKEFISFILKPENYVKWFGDTAGYGLPMGFDTPICKSILSKPPYSTSPIWKIWAEAALTAGYFEFQPFSLRTSLSIIYTRGDLPAIAGEVVLGNLTPKEATTKLIELIYEEIKKNEGLETINKNSPTVLPPP